MGGPDPVPNNSPGSEIRDPYIFSETTQKRKRWKPTTIRHRAEQPTDPRQLPDERNENLEPVLVVSPLRNDEVCVCFRRFYEVVMTGTHDLQILGDHGLGGSSPLADITAESPDEPDVVGSIDVQLQIQQLTDPLVIQHHEPLDDNQRTRSDSDSLFLSPMMDEIVLRHVDASAILQHEQMLVQQIGVERIGMIEIECGDVLVADEFGGMI